MNVCIVSALTMADFVDPDITLNATSRDGTPQLGVLCLAAALIEKGFEPQIINLDQCFVEHLRELSAGRATTDFFTSVVQRLWSTSADVFGFSTICSSYPLTLRLARKIKEFHPQALVILGGPQATVVDETTLRAFDFIDLVVRGEGDHTFPAVLMALSGQADAAALETIPGVTYRKGSHITRNPNASVIADLDLLPLPAFHLDPFIAERRGLHLEIGRGCPFACTFCSTNDFFRRNFRLKSTPKMLEHMKHLNRQYGISSFSLVHDMYTINRNKVVEFCEALLESGEAFTWSCSARTDCVDDGLIALMARAGCEGIFFGIETGSPRMQKIINKKLDLAEATRRIQCASNHGITTAVALITGFPEEQRKDFRQTIHYFVDSLRFGSAEPQLSLLAPLASTPIQLEYKDKLELDYIFSDMSHQGWQHDKVEIGMIREHPAIFPNFYAVPTSHIGRAYFKDVRDFVVAITSWFHWLPVALLQDSGDLLAIFDDWKTWQTARFDSARPTDGPGAPYYYRREFPEQLLDYIKRRYVRDIARAPQAIAAIADTEALVQCGPGNRPGGMPVRSWNESQNVVEIFGLEAFPYRPPGLQIIKSDIDYKELIHCLRNKDDLTQVPTRRTTIAFMQVHSKQVVVRQLTALSIGLLQLCDGETPVKDLIEHWGFSGFDVEGIRPDKVCIVGLRRLREQGLVRFSPRPMESEETADEHRSAANTYGYLGIGDRRGQSPELF
jgi:radical SAM superfamily enzyme YgiQ (UPF0313 family)